MPAQILSLARANLNQPVNIRAESTSETTTVPETTQFVYQAHDLDKPAIIGKLLQNPEASKVMVFCTTKREVERLTENLKERGFKATSIHGDLSQAVREKSLEKFRSGKAQAIVCTDVAARGIDIDLVTHVINYNCPDGEATYIHRIGRTGRAGHRGVAITLIDWKDIPRWRTIDHALNLGMPNPEESYSTTPKLLEDLRVPEGATGRTIAEGEYKKAQDRRDDKVKPPQIKDGTTKHRREGRRTRRNNGVVVRQKDDTVHKKRHRVPKKTEE